MAVKKSGTKVLNPKFHPEMLNIGAPGTTAGFRRGWIIDAPTDHAGAMITTRNKINFLYNPSSISASHAVAAELADSTELTTDPQLAVDNLGPVVGQGTVSVPLYFDRTYELYDRSYRKKTSGRFGVYADVLAFYHFTKMTLPKTAEPTQEATATDLIVGNYETLAVWANQYPVSPMFPTLCYVYIGAFRTGTNRTTPELNRLKYYGQITSLEVTYTHWTHTMIPIRCAIRVNLELLADPNAEGERRTFGSTTAPTPAPNDYGVPVPDNAGNTSTPTDPTSVPDAVVWPPPDWGIPPDLPPGSP